MFGEFVKQKRLEKKLSLRAFCRLLGEDASNWSKIERGKLVPSQDEQKLEKIAQNSFQRGLGAGFKNDYEFRHRLTLWANKNALRVFVLYIENNPCAFWYGIVYGETFFLSSGVYSSIS